MIEAKDIYSGKVVAGKHFVVTATRESVFVDDFITASVDGTQMKAITNDKRVFSITELDLCTE